uniref:Sterol carrier protein 2b n=1 Tax=Gadus morhua TaxID=8049 RepID=A0A8C5B7R1_GADMO
MPEVRSPRRHIHAVFTSASEGLEGFKSHAVFQEINKKLQEEGASFVKKIGGVFAFKVKDGPDGKEGTWYVDVKNGTGCVHNDTGLLPGQAEDHWEHGPGHEAPVPAAQTGTGQAVEWWSTPPVCSTRRATMHIQQPGNVTTLHWLRSFTSS